MILQLDAKLLGEIQRHAEENYPEEGAGLILGEKGSDAQRAIQLMPFTNRSAEETRRHRYRLDPQDMLAAEMEAQRQGLDILGIFHSHPDHPAEPSQYDTHWAFPWFSNVITSVKDGRAHETRCWRLSKDRSGWTEEQLAVQGASEREK